MGLTFLIHIKMQRKQMMPQYIITSISFNFHFFLSKNICSKSQVGISVDDVCEMVYRDQLLKTNDVVS